MRGAHAARGSALLAALAIALTSCGSDDPGGTAPAGATPATGASPSPSPTGPETGPETAPVPFESARHGYRLEVPAGWLVNEYDGTWAELGEFSPGAEVPGEDVFAVPDRSAFLVMNSMALPDGTAPGAWLAAFDAVVAAERDPACPAETKPGELAGRPATVVEESCDGSVVRGISLVHAGRGYYFTVRGPADDPETLAVLDALLASVELTAR